MKNDWRELVAELTIVSLGCVLMTIMLIKMEGLPLKFAIPLAIALVAVSVISLVYLTTGTLPIMNWRNRDSDK